MRSNLNKSAFCAVNPLPRGLGTKAEKRTAADYLEIDGSDAARSSCSDDFTKDRNQNLNDEISPTDLQDNRWDRGSPSAPEFPPCSCAARQLGCFQCRRRTVLHQRRIGYLCVSSGCRFRDRGHWREGGRSCTLAGAPHLPESTRSAHQFLPDVFI